MSKCFSCNKLITNKVEVSGANVQDFHLIFKYVDDKKEKKELVLCSNCRKSEKFVNIQNPHCINCGDIAGANPLQSVAILFPEKFQEIRNLTCMKHKCYEEIVGREGPSNIKKRRACAVCDKILPFDSAPRCMNCKRVFYCGVDCQKKDWKVHRKDCFTAIM